ncbi:MAG: hypothetical protein KH031_09700 [Clostridiales bacterium]|nr:hypothetical protein [Clostridiales bacterium]
MDNTILYNAEEVACDFYSWLVKMDYCGKEDKIEDLQDMIKDFRKIQNVAPKLFNLLRSISG